MDNTIFVEKYRPKTLDDIVGQDKIVSLLKEYIKNKKIPHMLFAGEPGTGKTSVAKALAKDFFGEHWNRYYLEYNASDETGVDVIRDKVKSYARSAIDRDFKIIFIDEADYMCLTGDTEIIVGSLENPSTRRLDSMIEERKLMIPSVNPNTLKLENDRGCLVDSGYTNFFEVTLENGSIVKASENHPFFKIKNEKLVKVKLAHLKEGDEIVELKDKVYNKCRVCSKYTFNKNCCSVECQNKYHSLKMKGKGNSMYGKKHTKKTKQKMSEILSDGRFAGENNPNYGGIFHGLKWFEMDKDVQEEVKKKISEAKKGKTFEMLFGENHIKERVKRNPNSNEERIRTNIWIKEKLKSKFINCEICNRKLKTSGNGKDSVCVHHIDGNHENHVVENIMFTCPYCHNMVKHNCKERLEKGWKITHGNAWNKGLSGKEYLIHFKNEKVSNQYIKAREKEKDVCNGIKIIAIEPIGRRKAWNITMEKNKNFILANGVVTHNTKNAQAALRRVIEMYSSKCRFIFSVNYPNKIINPIKDRCIVFRFARVKPDAMRKMIDKIVKNEGIDISEDAVELLCKLSNGSMRKSIGILEKLHTGNVTNINMDTIYDTFCYIDDDNIRELLGETAKGNIDAVCNYIEELLYDRVYASGEVIESLERLLRSSKILPKEDIADALIELGNMQYRISVGASDELQLKAYALYLYKIYRKQDK